MEKYIYYLPYMPLKKDWEEMVHVFTMFFPWDRRSHDGFPAVCEVPCAIQGNYNPRASNRITEPVLHTYSTARAGHRSVN